MVSERGTVDEELLVLFAEDCWLLLLSKLSRFNKPDSTIASHGIGVRFVD